MLLPISIVAALLLVSQGVIQNFNSYDKVTTVEDAAQVIPQGPVASQEAIKKLGTNGGGFFNANSAHPFENPTPFSNLLEELLIFLIPAALTYTFGKMVKDTRQGWALFAAMTILFLAGLFITYPAEASGNPNLAKLGLAGGNMEGKEVRFGIPLSALWAVTTTDTSCGAVNAAHDSLTPLGGLVPLLNIELGEVVFGGVGAGIYGMLIFAILAVFIAGLMVGRTPEYLGKKIEQKEVKMVMLSVLVLADSAFWASRPSPRINPQGLGEQRAARSLGDPLRLFERRRQQRQRVRRHQREHALVQHDDRPRHAVRPLSDDHSAAGGGGQPGAEEEGAGIGGNVPHARSAVCGAADRHRRDCRRADVLPGALAGTDRGTFPDGVWKVVELEQCLCSNNTPKVESTSLISQKPSRARPLFDPPIVKRAIVDSFRKLNPRGDDEEPGHVRGGDRRRDDHARPVPRVERVRGADHPLALVHGAVRQLRRSHGGRARQGAGRHAAQDQDRDDGAAPARRPR